MSAAARLLRGATLLGHKRRREDDENTSKDRNRTSSHDANDYGKKVQKAYSAQASRASRAQESSSRQPTPLTFEVAEAVGESAQAYHALLLAEQAIDLRIERARRAIDDELRLSGDVPGVLAGIPMAATQPVERVLRVFASASMQRVARPAQPQHPSTDFIEPPATSQFTLRVWARRVEQIAKPSMGADDASQPECPEHAAESLPAARPCLSASGGEVDVPDVDTGDGRACGVGLEMDGGGVGNGCANAGSGESGSADADAADSSGVSNGDGGTRGGGGGHDGGGAEKSGGGGGSGDGDDGGVDNGGGTPRVSFGDGGSEGSCGDRDCAGNGDVGCGGSSGVDVAADIRSADTGVGSDGGVRKGSGSDASSQLCSSGCNGGCSSASEQAGDDVLPQTALGPSVELGTYLSAVRLQVSAAEGGLQHVAEEWGFGRDAHEREVSLVRAVPAGAHAGGAVAHKTVGQGGTGPRPECPERLCAAVCKAMLYAATTKASIAEFLLFAHASMKLLARVELMLRLDPTGPTSRVRLDPALASFLGQPPLQSTSTDPATASPASSSVAQKLAPTRTATTPSTTPAPSALRSLVAAEAETTGSMASPATPSSLPRPQPTYLYRDVVQMVWWRLRDADVLEPPRRSVVTPRGPTLPHNWPPFAQLVANHAAKHAANNAASASNAGSDPPPFALSDVMAALAPHVLSTREAAHTLTLHFGEDDAPTASCEVQVTDADPLLAELRSVRDRLAHDPPELAALTAQLEATIAQLVSHAKQYVWLEHVLYLPTPPASQSDGAKQGESSVDEGVHCSSSTGTVDADSACCDKGLSGSDEWFDSRLFNPKGRTLRPVHEMASMLLEAHQQASQHALTPHELRYPQLPGQLYSHANAPLGGWPATFDSNWVSWAAHDYLKQG